MNHHAPGLKEAKPPLGLLAWIAIYKFAKSMVALAAGLFVVHLLHKDLAKIAYEWIEFFGIDQQGKLAGELVERLASLNPHRLHFISAVLFLYTAMYLTEACGLLYEKRWAEWLTVVQTALLVPWEVYELARHPSWIKAAVLVVNLGVIAYLIWRMRHDDREQAAGVAERAALPAFRGAPPAASRRKRAQRDIGQGSQGAGS